MDFDLTRTTFLLLHIFSVVYLPFQNPISECGCCCCCRFLCFFLLSFFCSRPFVHVMSVCSFCHRRFIANFSKCMRTASIEHFARKNLTDSITFRENMRHCAKNVLWYKHIARRITSHRISFRKTISICYRKHLFVYKTKWVKMATEWYIYILLMFILWFDWHLNDQLVLLV